MPSACINKTTCPYCGVGCGVNLQPASTALGAVPPVSGDIDHPANFGRLCVKGSALADTLSNNDRLLTPSIHGREATWPQAIEAIATKIKQVTDEHGPDAFGFYLSGQMLTEDYYVANKLAKGFIGTANVDTNSRLCMASAVVGYKRAFGSDTVPCSYEDLDTCDLLILVGSNAAWTHPVLYQRMVAAKAKHPSMRVVVIDPRKTATCELADLHLAIIPGCDALIFNTLLIETARRGQLNNDYIAQHTNGFAETLITAQESADVLEDTAKACGVNASDLEQLIDWWCSTPKTVTFYSQGVNQSSSGVDKCNAIINCHLATGRLGREGMGPFSITGQPNAMGGREVGGLANQLAAHMDFHTPGAIDRVQRFWHAPNMATQNGLKAIDMFNAVEQKKIKVLWIMSTNPMVSLPDTAQIKRALKNCEMVIVSECQSQTDTSQLADILLPASRWGEKDGTVTNSERRISRQRGLLPAPGGAKPDWWAICQVASALGFGDAFNYAHSRDIFIEHAALSAFENNGERDFNIGALSQLTREEYDALAPIQWPVTEANRLGTKRMFTDHQFFTANKKANFIAIAPQRPMAAPRTKYPYILNTGRVRDQWHTMTRTGQAEILGKHSPQPYVDLHPQDARANGIEPKQLVKVSSPTGSVIVRANITDRQRVGEIFVPIHWTRQFSRQSVVSNLIPQVVDPLSGQPESKHAIAQIRALTNLFYGFIISEQRLDLSQLVYWSLVPQSEGYRYEIALPQTEDLNAVVTHLNRQIGLSNHIDSTQYSNAVTGSHRFAFYTEGRLRSAYYFSKTVHLTGQEWLSSLLKKNQEWAVPSIDDATRISVASGRLVDSIDRGKTVCACFNVGENQILHAIDNDCTSVEQLIAQLKCGSNCGSCVPELKGYFT